MNELKTRKPPVVDFGIFKVYCDSFRSWANTAVTEMPSVTGVSVISNKNRHHTHIQIKGRIYDEGRPMFLAGVINNMQNSGIMNISYRGIYFRSCFFCGYSVEDNGEDYISVTIELISQSPVNFSEAVTG